jgi:protein required for attachment to host cells
MAAAAGRAQDDVARLVCGGTSMTTWILVADEARARLLEAQGADGAVVEHLSFIHEEGRQHPRDVIADRLPRAQESVGGARHAIEPQTDLETVEAGRFAHELAAVLETGRVGRAYERLVLVAPPRFLGTLRAVLSDEVHKHVVGSLPKDVTRESVDAIRERVKSLL